MTRDVYKLPFFIHKAGMWENVNEFPKTKRRKYPQYTSEAV